MNKILLTTVILLVSATSCIKNMLCIDGNGIMETETRITDTFNKAVNTTSADLIYHKADTVSIKVRAESNILGHILTLNTNGTLEIRTDPPNICFDYNQRPVVTITSPELNIMEMTGSGSFTADTLLGNSVVVKSTGSGDILAGFTSSVDLTVIQTGSGKTNITRSLCRNADLTVTGSGNLRIRGGSNTVIMRITGSGDIESDEFRVITADETITGSGNIFTHVEDNLKAVISGSGNIYLRGNPLVNQTITGSGRVIKY